MDFTFACEIESGAEFGERANDRRMRIGFDGIEDGSVRK